MVSALAKIGNIIQKYRFQIMGESQLRRSSTPDPVIGRVETYPPLAALRAEMKDACTLLEVHNLEKKIIFFQHTFLLLLFLFRTPQTLKNPSKFSTF